MTASPASPAAKVTVVSSKPLVSVIIAMHNEAPCIIGALQSIVRCEYDNVELIIVNDGSVDGSDALVAQYLDELAPQESIDKCLLLSKACSNKYLALGVGMAHAQGNIVVTLDADARLKPQSLQKLAKKYGRCSGAVLHQHIGGSNTQSLTLFRDRFYRVPQPVSRMVHKAYMRVGMRSSK